MGQSVQKELVTQIFELFNTGEEAVAYLQDHGLEQNQYLLGDLETLCTAIASAIEQLAPQITLKNKLKEIGLNAPLTAGRIRKMLDDGDGEGALVQFTCSFAPLFLFWRRYAEFFLCHAASDETLKEWYAQEREHIRQIRDTPKRDEPREYRFDFSIVVLFYGNQKMTKECLDAIGIYTKGHSYELITFDNGSDPETTAWCEGLPHVKKIYYPHNIGSSAAGNLIFTMAPSYMEGKYLLYVSNDVIVTPRYDDILWQCMESDPRIAMAVPVCNSASNLQAISVPYAKNDIKGMLSFAEGYNHCDPKKWEDRSRLFSILACMRPDTLKKMSLAIDPLFCYDMFADDDFNCVLRRMGYRQVLCKDVFVHHYGSATIGEGQFQVMELGRAQFRQKHGVDAWASLGMDLCAALNSFSLSFSGPVRILALNPMFGESVLALVNRLRACGGREITVDALTEDGRYLEDMEGLFHRSGLMDGEDPALEGQYDIAIVGCNLNRCADLHGVLHTAARRLKTGGTLITQHENFFGLSNLTLALQGKLPADGVFLHDPAEGLGLRIVTDSALTAQLQREGMILENSAFLSNESWVPTAEKLISALGVQQADAARNMLVSLGKFNLWRKNSERTGERRCCLANRFTRAGGCW